MSDTDNIKATPARRIAPVVGGVDVTLQGVTVWFFEVRQGALYGKVDSND